MEAAWLGLGLDGPVDILLDDVMPPPTHTNTPAYTHAYRRHDLEAAWLGLEPDGPVDLFLDDVLALAWNDPLRFAGMLLMVVAGAAFLALVRLRALD